MIKIYSRETNYLFDDYKESLLKVKQAFGIGSITSDLPHEVFSMVVFIGRILKYLPFLLLEERWDTCGQFIKKVIQLGF